VEINNGIDILAASNESLNLKKSNIQKMRITGSLLFLMLTMSLSTSLEAQQKTTDKKIKSIIVSQERYDMLVTRKYKDSEQFFDIKGNLLEDITYKQGKINKHFKYQYDSDNNKIKEEEFDPSGRLIESSEYKYENGLRTEKYVYDPNKKLKSKRIYHYTTF
jgi:antitoxin component YwqK of YwqJK toxin-antitoxin module